MIYSSLSKQLENTSKNQLAGSYSLLLPDMICETRQAPDLMPKRRNRMDVHPNEDGNPGHSEKTAFTLGLISSGGTLLYVLISALLIVWAFSSGSIPDSFLALTAMCSVPVLGILFIAAITGVVFGTIASKKESPASKRVSEKSWFG
jgi:hypothetical protein